jgi:hypothetical protein
MPVKLATALFKSIAFVIAPFPIDVAFPILVTTPVKFALVITVAAFPLISPNTFDPLTDVIFVSVTAPSANLIVVIPPSAMPPLATFAVIYCLTAFCVGNKISLGETPPKSVAADLFELFS